MWQGTPGCNGGCTAPLVGHCVCGTACVCLYWCVCQRAQACALVLVHAIVCPWPARGARRTGQTQGSHPSPCHAASPCHMVRVAHYPHPKLPPQCPGRPRPPPSTQGHVDGGARVPRSTSSGMAERGRGPWLLRGAAVGSGIRWVINLLAGPPRGRAAHDIYVGDLSAMQFNIPRPLRVCACVRVCVAPSPCRPMPPPCPPSHLEPPGLPLSPTSISPHLAPTLAGQDEHPRVHGHGWGVSEQLGCGQHSPPAVPTLALPGCQPARGWQQGPRPVAAKLGGTASLVPATPRGRGSWGPPPFLPPYPSSPPAGMR